jgi:predicted RNA-binding protein with PUA-like domain
LDDGRGRVCPQIRSPGTLDELKASPPFNDMMVTRRGSRLSIRPFRAAHATAVIKLGFEPGSGASR